MAQLTKEQQEAEAQRLLVEDENRRVALAEEQARAAAAAAATPPGGFVKVFKQGETLEVHPTCVKDHVANGWVVVKK